MQAKQRAHVSQPNQVTQQAKQGAHIQLQAKQRAHVNWPNQVTQQEKQGVHVWQQANQRAHVNRPNQVTQLQGLTFQEVRFGIKDAVLRELIGLGKVQVVTRSSKLSRSVK